MTAEEPTMRAQYMARKSAEAIRQRERGYAIVSHSPEATPPEFRPVERKKGNMSTKNPLSKQDIIDWAKCPACGAVNGEPCVSSEGSIRTRSHFIRMQRAQAVATAVDVPRPRVLSRNEALGLIVATGFLVVGMVAAFLWGNAILDYVLDVMGLRPDFTPTQLPTL